MKIAHLILAHSEPTQLGRLVGRLSHSDTHVYIHLDEKTDIGPFKYLQDLENVFFIKNRVKVYWGTPNIIQATLNGFKEIRESGIDYQYLNLLSGQDYPLKSAGYFFEYLSQNPNKAFMNFLLFDPDWLEALPRVQAYHFNGFNMPARFTIQKLVNKLLPQRKMPNGLIPVGRSQWFTIPLNAVGYIVDYWESHAALRRFIKFTWAPDEFIFQTILYNSEYRNIMINEDLRYIDWSAGGVSPKMLTMEDANALIASDKLFARKFDRNKDKAVLDFIDERVDG